MDVAAIAVVAHVVVVDLAVVVVAPLLWCQLESGSAISSKLEKHFSSAFSGQKLEFSNIFL